jgi:hypothetical protein
MRFYPTHFFYKEFMFESHLVFKSSQSDGVALKIFHNMKGSMQKCPIGCYIRVLRLEQKNGKIIRIFLLDKTV